MSLYDDILSNTKIAMKESQSDPQAKITLSVLRMLNSEVKYKKIDAKSESITDEMVLEVINSMIKKRRDSVEMYEKGNRPELADNELNEIKTLSKYLPPQLSDDELQNVVKQTIDKLSLTSIKEMGKAMGILSKQLKGKAEGSRISAIVKSILQ